MANYGRFIFANAGCEIYSKYNCGTINATVTRLINTSCVRSKKKPKDERKPSSNAPTGTGKRLNSVADSLASKGFLRSAKPYLPPENVAEKIKAICSSCNVPTDFNKVEDKFKLLEACFQHFRHSVPNSQLSEITTIDDVIKFYQTSVDTTVPLDAMKNIELPENLHIQHEYVRFHPETDTMFGGKSAFPKSSTLVTGLKYREKYRGHEAKRSWP